MKKEKKEYNFTMKIRMQMIHNKKAQILFVMLNALNYFSLFIIVHAYLVFSFDILGFNIDSKRITQKIISKKIMYELQYNNILWKWKNILEPKTRKKHERKLK